MDAAGNPVLQATSQGIALSMPGPTLFSDNDGQARIPSSFEPIRWVNVSKPGFKTSAMIDVESGGNGLKPCQCVRASDLSPDLSTPASLRRITVPSDLLESHGMRPKPVWPRLVMPTRFRDRRGARRNQT